jgi:hypothetical protein
VYIIRDNPLYETDDFEEIQMAFEGYLYGSHRGLDEKEYDKEHRIKDYIDIRYKDEWYERWIGKRGRKIVEVIN